jgi:hypothetical protein
MPILHEFFTSRAQGAVEARAEWDAFASHRERFIGLLFHPYAVNRHY